MGLARFLELVSSEWWSTTGCLDQFCPPTHMGVLTSESERGISHETLGFIVNFLQKYIASPT